MTLTRLDFYAAIVLILAAFIGLHLWDKSGKDVAVADTTAKVLKEYVDNELAKVKQDRKVTEPAQIVERLNTQYVPLPKPIVIAGPQSSNPPVSSVISELPNAPSAQIQPTEGSLVIPKESVSAFYQHELDCKENSTKLTACEKARDEYKKASKGGGFKAQLKDCAIKIGLGAGVGGAFGGSKGAIAGSAAGGATCLIW